MSTNKTENYQLHLWEPEDNFLRDEFNENNVKVDEALRGLDQAMPVIVTGSYVGTGTCGANNPNSLTFPFEPKLVMITHVTNTSGVTLAKTNESDHVYWLANCEAMTETFTEGTGLGRYYNSKYPYGKKVGNTIYWYHPAAPSTQMNDEGSTYYYIAIG